MVAAGMPRTAQAMDFRRWATLARRTAPRELADFLDACRFVKDLMARAG